MKCCSKCKQDKPEDAFYKDKRTSTGIKTQCKECILSKNQEWNKQNKQRKQEINKLWSKNNSERLNKKAREWYRENKEARQKYIADNREIRNFYNAQRRAIKAHSIPLWANLNAIKDIYTEAQRLEKLDGVKRHVDHIDPLQNKYVCGFHCESNLQILTAEENQCKYNKFTPYSVVF